LPLPTPLLRFYAFFPSNRKLIRGSWSISGAQGISRFRAACQLQFADKTHELPQKMSFPDQQSTSLARFNRLADLPCKTKCPTMSKIDLANEKVEPGIQSGIAFSASPAELNTRSVF